MNTLLLCFYETFIINAGTRLFQGYELVETEMKYIGNEGEND